MHLFLFCQNGITEYIKRLQIERLRCVDHGRKEWRTPISEFFRRILEQRRDNIEGQLAAFVKVRDDKIRKVDALLKELELNQRQLGNPGRSNKDKREGKRLRIDDNKYESVIQMDSDSDDDMPMTKRRLVGKSFNMHGEPSNGSGADVGGVEGGECDMEISNEKEEFIKMNQVVEPLADADQGEAEEEAEKEEMEGEEEEEGNDSHDGNGDEDDNEEKEGNDDNNNSEDVEGTDDNNAGAEGDDDNNAGVEGADDNNAGKEGVRQMKMALKRKVKVILKKMMEGIRLQTLIVEISLGSMMVCMVLQIPQLVRMPIGDGQVISMVFVRMVYDATTFVWR
ncbi:uncharacterized protein DDB_G0290685-like [Chenopodium quinoa]|uniref:uncharacterized protein DDB_G0290685-like n=1 Tax=Chenopodium quinoa TaxID=63459 RepID=UPI000B776D2C|nr:uncharacterized protein DDB_G0290685-like [Chenopodium quinoa]